jgi:ribonuclease HI
MNASTPQYILFLESSRSHDSGQWRFSLRTPDGAEQLVADDIEPETRGERLDLLTVVRALEALDQPSHVTLVGCSRYVRNGLQYGLPEWRSNGWRWEFFGQMMPVKNGDLWQRLDRALRFHQVECRPGRKVESQPEFRQQRRPQRRADATLERNIDGPQRRFDAPHAALSGRHTIVATGAAEESKPTNTTPQPPAEATPVRRAAPRNAKKVPRNQSRAVSSIGGQWVEYAKLTMPAVGLTRMVATARRCWRRVLTGRACQSFRSAVDRAREEAVRSRHFRCDA